MIFKTKTEQISLDVALLTSLNNDVIGKTCSYLDYTDISNIILASKSLSQIIIGAKHNITSEYILNKKYSLQLLKKFSSFKNTNKCDYWEKLCENKLENSVYIPNILIRNRSRGDHCLFFIRDIDVITSIKIKGSFESIVFEIGGQTILRIHPIQLQIQQKDKDDYIEILNMNHLNIHNIIYHDTCIRAKKCDIEYQITGYNFPDLQIPNLESIHYSIKQMSFCEEIDIKNKESFKYRGIFNLSAICIILVIEPDKLKSVELNIGTETHKIDAKYLKVKNVINTEFYNYNIPFENCYYIPLFNIFSSTINSFNINIEFEKKNDYNITILYINENILNTMSGMAGLCLS
jgi:hypothetical protein